VTHSYRHRFGLVAGDPAYAEIERQLALQPSIEVPSVILAGLDDGVTPAQEESAALKGFSGPVRRQSLPGTGHNVPQEAPAAFADAVLSLLPSQEKEPS
jgi:pimeloyl-ACP methyl ester carboxylesterase